MSGTTQENGQMRDSVDSLIADAGQAMQELTSSRRETCNEHNERIRKLRDLQISLYSARASNGGEMFNAETTISPELRRLLKDPTHNL